MKFVAALALAVAALALASCDLLSHPMSDLEIAKDGSFTLDGKPVADQDLLKELTAIRERAPDTLLTVRTDRGEFHPRSEIAFKAVAEAGLNGTNGPYLEQERARKRMGLLGDALFIGAIVLPAVLVALPYALRAATPSGAMRNGFFAVLIAGLVIAVCVGIVNDIVTMHRSRGMGGWAWGFGIIISLGYTVPWTLLAGVVTGALAALRRRLRPPAAAPQGRRP